MGVGVGPLGLTRHGSGVVRALLCEGSKLGPVTCSLQTDLIPLQGLRDEPAAAEAGRRGELTSTQP